jgi:hypothetical protein
MPPRQLVVYSQVGCTGTEYEVKGYVSNLLLAAGFQPLSCNSDYGKTAIYDMPYVKSINLADADAHAVTIYGPKRFNTMPCTGGAAETF